MFPTIIPGPERGFYERNFAPFLTLYRYRAGPDGTRSHRVFERLIRYDGGRDFRSMEVWPLFDWYSGSPAAATVCRLSQAAVSSMILPAPTNMSLP